MVQELGLTRNIYQLFSEVLLKNKYEDQHKYQGKTHGEIQIC
jgi:hypothetical protein